MKNSLLPKSICLFSIVCLFAVSGCKQKNKEHTSQQQTVKNTWYRNPLIYNVDVAAFKDSDGDGRGDFKGLIQKLGYLKDLGVEVIWLSPFQPSPDNDDGYDITDYYGIDGKLGTQGDFKEFMRQAKEKKIRVIMDIVLNHTSIEHPWYQAARADSLSKYRSWYVWANSKPKDWNEGMVFPGVQTETWTYDEIAKKYYFHRFYDFQPDLNYQHKEVQQEAAHVLSYWLKQGLDGFRLDAVPFIIDIPESGAKNPKHMFDVLTMLRDTVKSIKPDALLLGEANVTAKENRDYFGAQGNRLQMMFNFYADQFLFYALAEGKSKFFTRALEQFKEKPADSQWAFFLRNHDEIDLGRLSKSQRQKVFSVYGPQTNMQLYKRGIRRRLAPMLENPAMIKMVYSLLFSLPGAPVLRYGEELGMGDDLTLQERLSVRTPMQWDSQKNGGFSTAMKTFRPVISLGNYGYPFVNVDKELKDTSSLLNFIKSIAALRKLHPEIGLGKWEILSSASPVSVIRYTYQHKQLITMHNFSADAQHIILDKLITGQYKLKPLIDAKGFTSAKEFNLKGYGFQWYAE